MTAEEANVTDPGGLERIEDICVIATRMIETYDKLRAQHSGGMLIVNPFELLTDDHYQMIRGGFVMNEAFRFYLMHLQKVFGKERIDVPSTEMQEASRYLLAWMFAYDELRQGQV
jgi:hypothetical protein